MFRSKKFLRIGFVVLTMMMFMAVPAFAGDPVGELELTEGSAAALTFLWLTVSAALVFLMQMGFLLVEAGLTRSKNAVNISTKNMVDFVIAVLAYWAFGFAFMYGSGPLDGYIGLTGFGLLGDAYDVTTLLDFTFQVVFAATAATIVSGAMSERTKISSYMAYSFLVTALLYPVYGHWVWSANGWLSALGAHDFAGSGVVHALGGGVALIGAKLVGPRLGKYNKDGTANEMPAHNMVYVALGTIVLIFGWIGFNGGSTLGWGDLRVSVVVTNTLLAASAGGLVAMYIHMIRSGGIVDLGKICNGILAGLVGITAPCAVVAPWGAVAIGAIAGLILLWSESFIEKTLKIDDPVGASSVHGTCGLWGIIAVGIFADGSYGIGSLLTGDVRQFGIQLLMAAVIALWSVGGGFVIFSIIKSSMGLRVSREEELSGLDVAEHGVEAYGGDISI